MHDRPNTRRDPRRGADSLGIAGGALVAAGTVIAATGTHSAGALVAGLLTLVTGLVVLVLAADAWDRSASRSEPFPRTAVRWATSPRPSEVAVFAPLAIGAGNASNRSRVVSLPYGELPPARR